MRTPSKTWSYELDMSYVTRQASISSHFTLSCPLCDPTTQLHISQFITDIMHKRKTTIPNHDPLTFKGNQLTNKNRWNTFTLRELMSLTLSSMLNNLWRTQSWKSSYTIYIWILISNSIDNS